MLNYLLLLKGSRCESAVNPCIRADGRPVCLNNGLCLIDFNKPPNFYECHCILGTSGLNCEITTTTRAPPTTTLLPTTPSTCQDRDQVACLYYAQSNFCDYIYFLNQYDMSVPDYCPKSCNICDQCRDTQSNCVLWAAFNLCYKLTTIYPHPCRKSCNLC